MSKGLPMRRLGAFVLTISTIALAAVPVLAQQRVDPVDVLVDALPDGGREFVSEFVKQPTVGAGTVSDPARDFEHSTGEPPGYTPPHIDILDTWAVVFDPTPLEPMSPTAGIWAETGIQEVEAPNYGPFHTFTGEEPHDGTQYADGTIIFGFTLGDTPPVTVQGRCEYLAWVNDLSRGSTFINHPSFPGDPAAGTNIAFGLAVNPERQGPTSTFTLELSQDTGGFEFDPETDVRSFITPDFVGITVPKNRIGELVGVNFYTFCSDEGSSFESAHAGADQTGLIDMTFDDLGLITVVEILATTTTLPAETTSTVGAPPPTAAGPSQPAVVVEEDGFPWWTLVVGGLVLSLLGWWLYGRRADGPCRDLRASWVAAKRACAEEQRAARRAADRLAGTEKDLEHLEEERRKACKAWPPACWPTEDGGWLEDDRGNRITARDVYMRKKALGEIWADYKAGKFSATEIEELWSEKDTPEFRQEMRETDIAFNALLERIDVDIAEATKARDEALDRVEQTQATADRVCEAVTVAKKAYDDCVDQA